MNVREWALPVYTILMQLAVGALFVLWLAHSFAASKFSSHELNRINRNPILVIAFTAVVAMGGSHFHLSRPFHSFLAVLNFRSSWLSREIVFTLFFFLTILSLLYFTYFQTHRGRLINGLGWMASLFGCVVVYCMARIYLIPTQVAWNSTSVIASFFVTSLTLGAMTIALLMVLDLKFAEIKKSDDVELRMQVIKHSFGGLTVLTIALVTFERDNYIYPGASSCRGRSSGPNQPEFACGTLHALIGAEVCVPLLCIPCYGSCYVPNVAIRGRATKLNDACVSILFVDPYRRDYRAFPILCHTYPCGYLKSR